MTKRLLLLLSFLMISPVSAFAAGFTAAINNDHVEVGQSLTLQLTLSGTEPKAPPNIGALTQSFTVVSQKQSSNTIGVNGAAGSSIVWQLTLTPKQQGQLVIPAVTIDTVAGKLSTTPVMLEVDPNPAAASSRMSTGGGAVSIAATASTMTPYQNQPIQYTVRYVVRANILHATLGDINVNNAIVEDQGKPDVYDRIENGAPVKVVEFHYTVTALQPGKIRIPPVVLQGEIETPDRVVLTDPFGRKVDSAGLQQAMNFFSRIAGGQAFSIASNETVLDVKPPAAALDPWLPLTSLKISEDVNASQQAQVGEPLTRKISVLADGVAGSQLPDLEAQQNHTDFKVYADKPTTGEDVDGKTGTVLGWRKESYSLVPQKAGHLILPAIRISWWDIANNKVATAQLPKRIVQVLPGAAITDADAAASNQGIGARQRAMAKPSLEHMVLANVGAWLFYGFAGAAAAVLLFFALWRMRARSKISRSNSTDASARVAVAPVPGKVSPKAASRKKLQQVHTAEALKDFLQAHAHEQWNMPKEASMGRIFEKLTEFQAGQVQDDAKALITGLTAALYGGEPVDVENLKFHCRRVVLKGKSRTRGPRSEERLPRLNPS